MKNPYKSLPIHGVCYECGQDESRAWQEGYDARQKETKTAIKLAETLVDYILEGDVSAGEIFGAAVQLDQKLAKLRNQ